MAKTKKKKILLIVGISVLALFGIVAADLLYSIFHRTTTTAAIADTDRTEQWKSDLAEVKTRLPKLHKNLFFSLSEMKFNSEMNSLIGSVDKLDDDQIKAGLVKIINSVNDSHTSVAIGRDSAYPLSFFEFEEGVYLTNSSLNYVDQWGKKLSAINGLPVGQLKKQLDPYLSHDNQSILKNQFCSMLKNPEILRLAGISSGNVITCTFDDGSKKTDLVVKPLTEKEYRKEKFLSDNPAYSAKFPLPRQNSDRKYWFQADEKTGSMYVNYNSCSFQKGYSFRQFTKDVFRTIDEKRLKTLIIDLRDNGGGSSLIFGPFLREIKKHDSINQKGRLYVITGRRTFSSAVLNAMDLRNETNAMLVGEPTGGRPNHFGEVKTLRLTNVHIDIQYSSNYFKTSKEDTDSIYPDITVQTKAASFFSGKDDCLEDIYGEILKENGK